MNNEKQKVTIIGKMRSPFAPDCKQQPTGGSSNLSARSLLKSPVTSARMHFSCVNLVSPFVAQIYCDNVFIIFRQPAQWVPGSSSLA